MVPPGASDIWSCGSSSLPPFSCGNAGLEFFHYLPSVTHTHLQSYSTALRQINAPVIQWLREGHHLRAVSSISFLHSNNGQLESDDSYKFQLTLSPENWEESHSQPAKNQKARAHTLELTSVPLQLKQFLATVRKWNTSLSQSTCCRNWPPSKTYTIFTQKEYNIITQHLKNTRTWRLSNRMR